MERSGMFSATYTSLSTVTKRYLKTKVQINTEPLHCTSILLAPVPFFRPLSMSTVLFVLGQPNCFVKL